MCAKILILFCRKHLFQLYITTFDGVTCFNFSKLNSIKSNAYSLTQSFVAAARKVDDTRSSDLTASACNLTSKEAY